MQYLLFALFTMGILVKGGCHDKTSSQDLKSFAATETYPEDNFLETVSNKRALVIVAHDDDDCAMSGTIAKLSASGWDILQLSLVSHPVNDGSGQNPAKVICNGNELLLPDGYYRMGLDTMKTAYLPISRADMEKQFLKKKMTDALVAKVNAYNPSVIFTLDNIKGGYGHPEHIFISQLVVDLFSSKQIPVQAIYQSVYTDHMEEEIVDTWLKAKMDKWGYPHPSSIANQLYGIDGMPEPTVQINISDFAETKMKYLRAYPEKVRKNIRKFIPYYEDNDAETYFSIFDREFFRVIQ